MMFLSSFYKKPQMYLLEIKADDYEQFSVNMGVNILDVNASSFCFFL